MTKKKRETTPKPDANDPMRVAAEYLCYLRQRWQDEHECEDWQDYIEAMSKRLPPGATDVTMTERPFRVSFRVDGQALSISADARGASYTPMVKLVFHPGAPSRFCASVLQDITEQARLGMVTPEVARRAQELATEQKCEELNAQGSNVRDAADYFLTTARCGG